MDISSTIAKKLLEKQAVKISLDPPFTWASGIKSPIYCDNRMLISFPDVREIIVDAFCEIVKEKNPDYVAGTATAAIPWAAFVAQKLSLPMVYVRSEPKDHGAGKQIEGHLDQGKNVVLIEDLISTGGSSIKAAEALRNEGGAIVTEVLAIVTYEMEKSKNAFAENNLNLNYLTDFSHLLEEVKKQGYLSEEQVKMVLGFSADPPNWWESINK